MAKDEELLRVDVVDCPERIYALKAEWAELEGRTPEATGFQSFDWCWHWVSAARRASASLLPRIVTVREGSRLVMIWALQIETFMGLRCARCLGQPATQYGDILSEPGSARLKAIRRFRSVVARWKDVDLIYFVQVRADGALAGNLQNDRGAPYCDLRIDTLDERRHRIMHNLRRRLRKLNASGKIDFATLQDSDSSRKVAAKLYDWKRTWVLSRGFSLASLDHPITKPFIEDASSSGLLTVHCLRVDGEIVAGELGFTFRDTYRSIFSAYDHRFAFGSPGHVITDYLIGLCRERGLSEFDFLAPADESKMRWADGVAALSTLLIPLTRKGRVAMFFVSRCTRAMQAVRLARDFGHALRAKV